MADVALIRICDAGALHESDRGVRFDVDVGGRAATGFVLRWRGRAVGFLNQCAHVAMELDWMPGEFLDSGREFIMCATHGAIYDPATGHCLGGPCQGRGGLRRIAIVERDGAVWWAPDAVIKVQADSPRESTHQIPPASTPGE